MDEAQKQEYYHLLDALDSAIGQLGPLYNLKGKLLKEETAALHERLERIISDAKKAIMNLENNANA